MDYKTRYMMLKDIIAKRKETAEKKFADVESLIAGGMATPAQKQAYVELKAKIETYEEVLDFSDSLQIDSKE